MFVFPDSFQSSSSSFFILRPSAISVVYMGLFHLPYITAPNCCRWLPSCTPLARSSAGPEHFPGTTLLGVWKTVWSCLLVSNFSYGGEVSRLVDTGIHGLPSLLLGSEEICGIASWGFSWVYSADHSLIYCHRTIYQNSRIPIGPYLDRAF